MGRLVMAHPIAPGRVEDHLAWCDEIKERRSAFGSSRARVGIERQVVWTHPTSHLAVVRVDADDPVTSIRALARSSDEFDRWYAEREREIHGGPLLADGAEPPTMLTDYVDGEDDELDMFMAVAVPLLPGQADAFRRSVTDSRATGAGQERLRLWRMRRLTIWLQHLPDGDVVIYDAVGDLGELMDSLASSQDPLVAAQRHAIRQWYGIDLTTTNWPIPVAALSWTAQGASPV